MRKILLTIAVLGILLFMSCEQEAEVKVNPFVGTWEAVNRDFVDLVIVFSEETVISYLNGENFWGGTYTYNDTHFTVILDNELTLPSFAESHGDSIIEHYIFEDGLLAFSTGKLRRTTNNN